MSLENNLHAEKIEASDICKYAEVSKLRRGEAILCSGGYGKEPEILIPLLSNGDVCVATQFFSTGHINPDVLIDQDKMYSCPYRAMHKE